MAGLQVPTHQPFAPAGGQFSGVDMDPFGVHMVGLVECGHLADRAFNLVRFTSVGIAEERNVGLHRHQHRSGKLIVVIGAEDRLRTENQHLIVPAIWHDARRMWASCWRLTAPTPPDGVAAAPP
ncbi:hypothetical protein H7I94_31270 [Mycobacterium szulgai]|nr:hypothetical protein [Mycobacterium szulgai]